MLLCYVIDSGLSTSLLLLATLIIMFYITLHIVRQFRTARPTKFKLSVQMEDDDSLQLQAPRPPRSKVKVIRGPLMLTHIVRHIFRTARPTNFKLRTRMEDVDLHQLQASRAPRSKVKSQGHVISLSPLGPMCH